MVFFAPINIFLNIILVVNAGMDGKYMEAYWKVLGSFLFGLLIYVSYLSPNLQWYNLHKSEESETVEEQESTMVANEESTSELN